MKKLLSLLLVVIAMNAAAQDTIGIIKMGDSTAFITYMPSWESEPIIDTIPVWLLVSSTEETSLENFTPLASTFTIAGWVVVKKTPLMSSGFSDSQPYYSEHEKYLSWDCKTDFPKTLIIWQTSPFTVSDKARYRTRFNPYSLEKRPSPNNKP